MTIVERLVLYAQKYPHKIALIIDDDQYTYDEICKAIVCEGDKGQYQLIYTADGRKVCVIQGLSFYGQVVAWLWALYEGYIPIVCHNEINTTYLKELMTIIEHDGISEEAQFGVLTSGTTGTPKPLWRTELSWSGFFDIQNEIFHIQEDTTLFLQGSFSFTGVSNMVIAVLWAGGTIVTTQSLRPSRWSALIESYRVDHIYALPTKLRLLCRYSTPYLSNVRYIIAGSQVLDEQLMEQLQVLCPHMEFILYYGASELNYITYCSGQEWLERKGTVGKPFPSINIHTDEGLIYVTTDYHVEGVDQTSTVNDCGYIDSDGYLMFKGRNGDVINKGGYKISVSSMESYMQTIIGIQECSIIDITDSVRGEDFVVYVVLEANVTIQSIIESIHRDRPPVEWPKDIIPVPLLPLTECAKVDKRKLKEWYNNK